MTASHNPKAWAGFKLLREGALALSGDSGIPEAQREAESGDFSSASAKGVVEASVSGQKLSYQPMSNVEATETTR